jgi:hypothetical protein
MKILLIASLMVMVSAPVMARWGFSHKKIEKIKHTKVAPIVAVKEKPQIGIVAIKQLPKTKPMLVEQTDYRAREDATMRLPASAIQEKAEFIQLKRAAP